MCLLTVVLISVAHPLISACFTFFLTAKEVNSHTQAQWCLGAPGSSWQCDVAGESLHVANDSERWDHLTTSSLHNSAHPSSLALNYDLCH